jgi:hypothetical protein
MQSSSGQQPPRLSAAVSAELARLEAEVRQAADPLARPRLAGLGDAAASRVLRKIWENRRGVKRLSAYIMRMVEKEATESNAAAIPAAESSVPLHSAIQRQGLAAGFVCCSCLSVFSFAAGVSFKKKSFGAGAPLLRAQTLFRCTLKVEIFSLPLHHINLWTHA